MKKAPKSYLNARRPPLHEAMRLEEGNIDAVVNSLTSKGYFTPPPGPWKLGFLDRGLGHGDFAVLDRFDDLVAKVENRETAEFIIEAVNAHRAALKKTKK